MSGEGAYDEGFEAPAFEAQRAGDTRTVTTRSWSGLASFCRHRAGEISARNTGGGGRIRKSVEGAHPAESGAIRESEPTHSDPQPRETTSPGRYEADTGTPRTALVAALTAAIRDATAAGDLTAARIAHEALGRLLGAPALERDAVIDLASRRKGGRS